MRIGYDLRGDILFIDLAEETELAARRVGGERLSKGDAYIDLAEDGTILGIEIQGASKRYSQESLERLLAYPDEVISLSEASRISGIDAQALKKACQEGRMVGKKIGRNWTTTIKALSAYQQGRKHAGPGSKVAV
jgi:uncharacterized protein YuzE